MAFPRLRFVTILFVCSLFIFGLCYSPVCEASISIQSKQASKQASKRASKHASSHKVVRHKTKNKSRSVVQRAKAPDSRQIWLERARNNSETMLGLASWYGRDFNMRATASGVPYNMYTFTAAHRTLPFGTIVRVTDQYSGKSVMVCVTDRGPFIKNRIIDMSMAAASRIGLQNKGVSAVELEVVSDAQGHPLRAGEAFYVESRSAMGQERFGPYDTFADAAAVHEAMLLADPDASVVLDSAVQ